MRVYWDSSALLFGDSICEPLIGTRFMSTKHVKPIWLITCVCLGVAVLVLALGSGSKQPTYKRQPLAYWFNRLPLTMSGANTLSCVQFLEVSGRKYGSREIEPRVSIAAIQSIGTNGLPFLIHKITRCDLPMIKWIEACASKCGIKRSLFPDPELERGQAVTALLALSPLPESAILRLRKPPTNPTSSIGLSVGLVLAANTNIHLKAIIIPRSWWEGNDPLWNAANAPASNRPKSIEAWRRSASPTVGARPREARKVLDCASPLALSPR